MQVRGCAEADAEAPKNKALYSVGTYRLRIVLVVLATKAPLCRGTAPQVQASVWLLSGRCSH